MARTTTQFIATIVTPTQISVGRMVYRLMDFRKYEAYHSQEVYTTYMGMRETSLLVSLHTNRTSAPMRRTHKFPRTIAPSSKTDT